MANCFDVIAFVCDGEIICPDCYAEADEKVSEDVGTIFGDESADASIGATCAGQCGSMLSSDLEWDASPIDFWRWAKCRNCRAQRPFYPNDVDSRHEAMRGELRCVSCDKKEMHF